jgi:hypothetical protein
MRILATALALATLAPPAVAADADSSADNELIRMESAKWDPAGLRNPATLMSMFSTDMLSVDYGADLHGGVERRTWRQIIAYGPLPEWKVNLGDWRVLHPGADVAVVSYKVTGVSVEWKAYATSVWARHGGKWETVFYQASAAK